MSTTQQQFWTAKPREGIKSEPNQFAQAVYQRIQDQGYEDILDLGCGRSRDPIFFAQHGYQVTALDISANRLRDLQEAAAQQRLVQMHFLQQDLHDLDLPSDSFDVIYAHLSLHYFDADKTKQLIQQLKQALRSGGLLCAKVKSVDDPDYGKGQEIAPDMFQDGPQIRHFFRAEGVKELFSVWQFCDVKKSDGAYLNHQHISHYIDIFAQKR